MSFEVGGRSDKNGNIYENRFLAALLLDLIQERLSSVEVERLGEEGIGVEYIANELGGGRRYYQCKVSNGSNNYWRPSDLKRHNVFQIAKSHIISGEKCVYHFISPLAYDGLDSLCDRAKTCYNVIDFVQNQLTNPKLRGWWEKSKKYFNCANDEETIFLLSRCKFEQIPYGSDTIRNLESRIDLLFVRETPETPSSIRIHLENYVNDGHRWGKPITAQALVAWLQEKGYHQRMLSHDERGLTRVQELNRLYQESFRPIGAALFHRKESERILDYIFEGNSVIVLGKAGSGKSGCIHEVEKTLESQGIVHLVLSLDKYRPEKLPDKYGQDLGFMDSPVTSLHRLAAGEPCVLIFDQLDALRWTNAGTSKALDICKEMIQQAEQLNCCENGKIRFVFVARTFDYETDPGLRNLFEKNEKNKIQWQTIKVDLLSEEEMMNLLGDLYGLLSPRLRTLLRTPSNLYVWERIDTDSKNSITNLRQLMEHWWEETKTDCKEKGFSPERIDNCRDRLVSIMQAKEQLSLPNLLFESESQEIEALSSQGLLSESEEKISFVHQSFFDFFSVKRLLDKIYEDGKHLPELISDRDKQTPDVRYQLLMLLQYLYDVDQSAFLTECQNLLESPDIRNYFQCCAFDIFGQIEEPNQALQELIFKLYKDEKWHSYVFQTVFFGHPQFIQLLDKSYPNYIWYHVEGCALLRSAIYQDPELVLSILQKQGTSSFTHADLYDILSAVPPDRSEKAFAMRLDLLREDSDFLREEYDLYQMIKSNSALAIPMIQIIIEADSDKRKSLHFPEEKHLQVFAKNNAEEIVDKLLISAMQVAAKEENAYRYFDNKWITRYHSVTVEREIIHLIQIALSTISKNNPGKFFQILEECPEKSPIRVELMLHAMENLSTGYADQVITWLLDDFNNRAFDKTGNEKTELSCCKRVIERFSPFCQIEIFYQLETFLCQWSLSAEIMRTLFKERVRTQHTEGGGNYYASFWGDFQFVLLPALDSTRTSIYTKRLIGVLRRKFPNGTHFFDLSRITMAHFINSPIESHRNRLSDKSWVRLITDMSKTPVKVSSRRWEQGIESTPELFSQSLAQAAKDDPVRFAKLSLKFSSNVHEMFIDAIINALGSSDISLELACRVLRRFCVNPSKKLAVSFARVIEQRAQEDWPQDILQQLVDIAQRHEDPLPDVLPAYSTKIDVNQSCESLWLGSVNCARGRALHAINALLWSQPALKELFKDVSQSAVNDPNLSVQFAAMYCAVPWFNIDKEFSEHLFIQLIDKDFRTLAAPSAWQIVRLCYSKNPNYYRGILVKAAESAVTDLSTCALKAITILTEEDDWMMDKLLSFSLNKAQADAVCRQAAECFDYEWFHMYSKKILIHIIDHYPDSVSEMGFILYRDNIQINRDQDLLLKLLCCKDQQIRRQALDLLCNTDGDIRNYADTLSYAIKSSPVKEYFFDLKDLAALVARMFHQGKDDLKTRRKCLDLWDDIFRYKPSAVRPLSDLMDQAEI